MTELHVNDPRELHVGDVVYVALKGTIRQGTYVKGTPNPVEPEPEHSGIVIEDEYGYYHEVYLDTVEDTGADVILTQPHRPEVKNGQMWRVSLNGDMTYHWVVVKNTFVNVDSNVQYPKDQFFQVFDYATVKLVSEPPE